MGQTLNQLVEELNMSDPPLKYHENEDRLAEYVQETLNWPIRKEGSRWIGACYFSILEQGGFHDVNEIELVLACAGRIRAARRHNCYHFDDMDKLHQTMLSTVISVILYHRS
jgi:hypothetical protein